MCGIVGYVGRKSAVPFLLEGLKRLEYRGYDSSGIGIIDAHSGAIVLRKTQGKIKALEDAILSHPLPEGHIGISHTRWATHGAPSHRNAHPHFDCSKKFLLVHNGIVENYEGLRSLLQNKGHRFSSETDTEVIAHLIEEYYQGDFFAAVRKAVGQLRGAFALGIICKDHPGTLIAARTGSPLIVGIGKGENFIASDVPAILDRTRKIIYLKDGEIAVLTRDAVSVRALSGRRVKHKVDTAAFSMETVKKQGYAHFMLKEIYEQPAVIERMLQARLKGGRVSLEGFNLSARELKNIRHIFVVACGTAYHAGLVGKYVIEKLSGIPVSVDAASEFRYRDPILDKHTLIVTVSQSGETADTLAAVREARGKGARVVSICNVVGSSLARESDGILYTHAGPEIGVASTKAYTAQILMFYLLALELGRVTGKAPAKMLRVVIQALRDIPRLYQRILRNKNAVAVTARANSHYGCFLFLGRNLNYPSALEGALKLKEISYIPAEGYAAGEMKHGPIALIDEYRAVVCICPQAETYEKMISNMQEICARKGNIIAIATEGDKGIRRHAQHVLYVPPTHNLLTPLLTALPLQLLAYFIAVQLGCDVDQPRNLAKSVTVE